MSAATGITVDDLPEELRQYVPAGAKGMELARWGFQLVRLQRDLEKGQESVQFGSLASLVNQNHKAHVAALEQMKEEIVDTLGRVRDVEEGSAGALVQVKEALETLMAGAMVDKPPAAPPQPALTVVSGRNGAAEPVEPLDPHNPFAKVIDDEIKLSEDDLHTACSMAVELLPDAMSDRTAAAIKATQELAAGFIMTSDGLLKSNPWAELPSRGMDAIILGNLRARGVLPEEDPEKASDDNPAWVSNVNDEPPDS